MKTYIFLAHDTIYDTHRVISHWHYLPSQEELKELEEDTDLIEGEELQLAEVLSLPLPIMTWQPLHPRATIDMLGLIPGFFSLSDPRPAAEQLDEAYAHGGGWKPMPKWNLLSSGNIQYPGDPELLPLFETKLRSEIIRLYQGAWLAIIQEDGSFAIGRVD